MRDVDKLSSLTYLSAIPSDFESETLDNCVKLRLVVDRVYCHTSNHTFHFNLQTLLYRTGLWNNNIQKYLASTVEQCLDCKFSSIPPHNRWVSIFSFDRAFNDVARIDHFYLEDVTLFYVMNVDGRYSSTHIVSPTFIRQGIFTFELVWISLFWPSDTWHANYVLELTSSRRLHCNIAFNYFLYFSVVIIDMTILFSGVIRSILVQLRHTDATVSTAVLSVQSVPILSNP